MTTWRVSTGYNGPNRLILLGGRCMGWHIKFSPGASFGEANDNPGDVALKPEDVFEDV